MSVSDEYFRGGHWGQCLELLSHLSKYSDSILLVSGAPGTGKSSLKRALMQSEAENLAFLEIQATANLNADSLMARLDTDFDNPADKDLALLIEDAQHLSINAMAVLLQLKQRSGIKQRLHMVLFATPDFAQRLNTSVLKEEFAEMVHLIELEPLTLSELEEFLEHQLHIRQDKQWYKKIYTMSEGIPGKALQIAKDIMNGNKDILKTKRNISPTTVGFVVSFGLVFCLLAVLWPEADESVLKQTDPQTLASLADQPVDSTTQLEQEREDDIDQAPQPTPDSALAPVPEQTIKAPDPNTTVVTEPESPPEPEIEPQSQANEELTLAQAKIAQLEQQVKQLQARLEQSAKPKPVISTKSKAKAKNKLSLTKTTEKVSYNSDEKFILEKPAANFTLQLLGANSEKKMRDFIAENKLGKQARYFKSSYKGKPWYVLIYGNYTSRDQANSAISKLPLAVKKLRPWPREFARIHYSIKNDR